MLTLFNEGRCRAQELGDRQPGDRGRAADVEVSDGGQLASEWSLTATVEESLPEASTPENQLRMLLTICWPISVTQRMTVIDARQPWRAIRRKNARSCATHPFINFDRKH
jgi:hypothetical protein